ncbi:hypothetical protein TNIN_180601 [Trichonephila inaurata madagascariensis]|uniref:Uncharacterized protein n=1 Tax=Trichonephila inaurata madagascariensis TaxID=2747483 RepID=A0A8X6X2T1_9ARAC|nr:hypothetical protein TNIN_180601 [Trichonephila inaurata madagascariensis]
MDETRRLVSVPKGMSRGVQRGLHRRHLQTIVQAEIGRKGFPPDIILSAWLAVMWKTEVLTLLNRSVLESLPVKNDNDIAYGREHRKIININNFSP